MHTVTEACPLSLFLMLYSGLEKWQNKKAEKTCQKLCEIINHLFRSCRHDLRIVQEIGRSGASLVRNAVAPGCNLRITLGDMAKQCIARRIR